MKLNPDDYPPGFAQYAQPLLDARIRTLAAINSAEKLICKQILEAFPEKGCGPMFDEIVKGTGLPEENVSAGLDRLNQIDMIKYDEETGQVLVIYPLSTIPCPHQVHIKGKKSLYAM